MTIKFLQKLLLGACVTCALIPNASHSIQVDNASERQMIGGRLTINQYRAGDTYADAQKTDKRIPKIAPKESFTVPLLDDEVESLSRFLRENKGGKIWMDLDLCFKIPGLKLGKNGGPLQFSDSVARRWHKDWWIQTPEELMDALGSIFACRSYHDIEAERSNHRARYGRYEDFAALDD